MRKPILVAGLALLFTKISLQAQINLNWSSSFSPAWSNGNTSGNAINVGGYSINCSTNLTMVGGGVYVLALGGSGAQTPTVSGATFTVPGTTNRLQVTTNYTSNTSYTNIVLTFTTAITNATFKIVDIDKADATSTTYYDQVTVTGSCGALTFNPVLTKYDAVTNPNFLVISGNTARANTTSGQGGNTNSDLTDQLGTINVDFGTASITSITIRYDNAAGADANPASQAIAIGSVSFSQSTLPVSLTRFSGHRQVQDILLDWTTSQEINSTSFEVERSNGTNSWEKIGTIAAAGNSIDERNYSFTDINPLGSLLLYRLKQLDINGNYKYSGIVRINAKAVTDIQVYPNPFTDHVNISIHIPVQQQVSGILRDAVGKTLKTVSGDLFAGDNNFMIPGIGQLAKGIYYIEMRDEAGNLLGRSKLLKE